jgi:hypothetical protein
LPKPQVKTRARGDAAREKIGNILNAGIEKDAETMRTHGLGYRRRRCGSHAKTIQ